MRIKGRVTGGSPEALHLLVKDTSDPRNYPGGQTAGPESAVETIRYTTRRGPWRAIGAAAGGGAGVPAARAADQRIIVLNVVR